MRNDRKWRNINRDIDLRCGRNRKKKATVPTIAPTNNKQQSKMKIQLIVTFLLLFSFT